MIKTLKRNYKNKNTYRRKKNKTRKNIKHIKHRTIKHRTIKGGMKKQAVISEDGKYRYQLSRTWDEEKPKVLFLMLNPSTADANIDDPTIRRVVNFASSWGYGGVFVGNLYALRSTDPAALGTADDPIGKDNLHHVKTLVGMTDRVVYAWGNKKKEPEWLCNLVDKPYCIDISKEGIPKHPLYLKKELQPKPFIRDTRSHGASAASSASAAQMGEMGEMVGDLLDIASSHASPYVFEDE